MKSFDLPVIIAQAFEQDDRQYFQAIVCAASFPQGMPIEANLRHPNKQSVTYNNIVKTLIDDPSTFFDSNLGIRISAEHCEIRKINFQQILFLRIDENQGIANGAHTYFALHTARMNGASLERAFLPVIIQVGMPKEALPIICARLNTSTKVDSRSIGYKKGVFDLLKSKLENSGFHRIAYFQNQSHSLSKPELTVSRDKRCSVNHIIELLRCLDTKAWSSSSHPSSLVNGGFSFQGNATKRAGELFDCFETAFWVEKEMSLQIVKDATINEFSLLTGVKKVKPGFSIQSCAHFADGTVAEIIISSYLALPLVAAFRAFMTDTGWEYPPLEFREDLLKVIYPTYKIFLRKGHRDQKIIRTLLGSQEIWAILYLKALEFKTKYMQVKYKAS